MKSKSLILFIFTMFSMTFFNACGDLADINSTGKTDSNVQYSTVFSDYYYVGEDVLNQLESQYGSVESRATSMLSDKDVMELDIESELNSCGITSDTVRLYINRINGVIETDFSADVILKMINNIQSEALTALFESENDKDAVMIYAEAVKAALVYWDKIDSGASENRSLWSRVRKHAPKIISKGIEAVTIIIKRIPPQY